MANTNMPNIALYEAAPQINVPDKKHQGGRVYAIVDTVETPTILSINDTVTLCRLPVDAILTSFQMAVDDLGTAGDLEVGFYRTIADGAAVIDADILINVLDVNAAATAFTEFRYDTADLNTAREPVWELAGVAARPSYDFLDIKANATEATTAAGTISIYVQYTY